MSRLGCFFCTGTPTLSNIAKAILRLQQSLQPVANGLVCIGPDSTEIGGHPLQTQEPNLVQQHDGS